MGCHYSFEIMVSFSFLALFFWPPMIRFFIYTYTWRGANILLGGLILNCLVCGSLLRPAPMKRSPKVNTVNTVYVYHVADHIFHYFLSNQTETFSICGSSDNSFPFDLFLFNFIIESFLNVYLQESNFEKNSTLLIRYFNKYLLAFDSGWIPKARVNTWYST